MADMAADRQLADLNALLDVSRELGATTELLPLLQKVEGAVRQVLNCDRSTVFLHDAGSNDLYSLVATGEETIRFSAKLGIAGEAFSTRSTIIVHDAYSDNRFNRAIDRATGYRTRNILTFPMEGYDGKIVGVLQALNKHHGSFDQSDLERASDLGMLAGVAIQRQILLDEYAHKQQLERDLSLARDIQQKLLPKTHPTVPGYDIAGWNRPADATGGDCFDYLRLGPARLGILLADVTGHGIGPALIMSECRALVRALASAETHPMEVLSRTNVVLCDDLDGGRFVTAFFGVLDCERHEMTYMSAGHGPLLHYVRSEGVCRQIGASTYPLGIVADIDCGEPESFQLEPGDMLVLTTDGLFEWANGDGQQFGIDRMCQVIHESRDRSCEGIIHELYRRVSAFGEGSRQGDDVTAVIVKRL